MVFGFLWSITMNFKKSLALLLFASSILGSGTLALAQTTNLHVAFNGFGGTGPLYLAQDVGI